MTGINFAKLPVKNDIKSKKSKSLNQNEKNSVRTVSYTHLTLPTTERV